MPEPASWADRFAASHDPATGEYTLHIDGQLHGTYSSHAEFDKAVADELYAGIPRIVLAAENLIAHATSWLRKLLP